MRASAGLSRELIGARSLHVVVAALLAAPFLVFATVPLFDLPQHIARQHILFDGAGAAYYVAQWRLVPNLALDGFVGLLHFAMPVESAVRLFLALTAAQLYLGTVALNRALFGRDGGVTLAAALFVYSGPLLLGFVNECFGIGMAFWVLALWLGQRQRSALVPVFALLANVILLAHLFAFGVYALAVIGVAAGDARRDRRLVPLWHLALPLGLLAAMPGGLAGTAHWGGWLDKIVALRAAAGLVDPVFDAACFWVVMTGALVLARRLVIAPVMAAPLIALACAYLVLPQQWGAATLIDYRLPPVLLLLLVAGTAWRNPADPWRGRANRAVLALAGLRLAVLMAQWAAWQGDYAEYRAAFALLPAGARLLPLGARTDVFDPADRPPLGHVAALAVSERGALIPTLFAGQPHELLAYRPAFAALARTVPSAADAGAYDYILLIRPERLDPAGLPAYAPIARGETFVLGRILR